MNCIYCNSEAVIQKGERRGRQRFKCKDCGKWFSQDTDTDYKYEKRGDGTVFSDRLIQICETDLKDERKVLEAHKFDPEKWTLISYRHNLWHGPTPFGGKQVLYQSRVVVKPRTPMELTLDDIEKFFASPPCKKYDTPKKYEHVGDEVLEVVITDLHINRRVPNGSLSIDEKIECLIQDVLSRAKGRNISKVILVSLGDNLDVDTMLGTTTKGTRQDSSGLTPYETLDSAIYTFIYIINSLSTIAPVEVLGIPGNHDRLMSYAIIKSLECFYSDVDTVSVDSSHEIRKFRVIGMSLVGWMHGDMQKKYYHSWLPTTARKYWGETKYAEVHAGHLHTQSTFEKDGVIVRHLPSPSESSTWETERGYTESQRCFMSFVWGQKGLRDIWFTPI